MELKKREWVYMQNPNDYEIAACQCGNANTQWSEYEGHIWCDHCNIDFIPEHNGIFSGPIGLQISRSLGISFDKFYLNTNKYMRMEEELGIYVEPTTMRKIVETRLIEGNIHNEEQNSFEKVNLNFENFNINEKNIGRKTIYIYIGIPVIEKFKLNTDENGILIKNNNYFIFEKKITKHILDETLLKRDIKQKTKL